MAEPIKLSTDGLLLNWLKNVGDSVNAGDIVAEIEADKATMEIEAPVAGVLVELSAQPGDDLKEGAVIGMIGAAGEQSAAKSASKAEPAAEKADTPQPEAAPVTAATNGTAATTSVTEDGRIKASPVARKIAEDKGVNLAQVQGSGPGGRIVKADIEGFKPSAAPAPAAKSEGASAPAAVGGRNTYGKLPEASDEVEIIDVNRMRRAIADNTITSKQMTPHFYVTTNIDVNALLELRQQLNASLEKEGVKISVNDMVVKAAALALKKFPNLNTHYYGDKLVRYKRINIGISVALSNNGLLNVVAHDADKIALSALAERNKAMFERAREGKIKPEDIKGATFTISNLGPYDVDHFAAVISPPEAGILAIGSAKKVPIVKEDGTIGVGNRMNVTLSVDHRVSDGAEGAEYLKELKNLIENPMRLLV